VEESRGGDELTDSASRTLWNPGLFRAAEVFDEDLEDCPPPPFRPNLPVGGRRVAGL